MIPTIVLSLAASVLALPAAQQSYSTPEPTRFGGIAIHSGSDIQYASVAANGLQFYLNKATTTYCPEVAGVECPTGNTTIFSRAEGSTSLGLSTSVPGGQLVYVAPDGLLKFTQAHSGNTGENATLTGFGIADGALEFEGQSWYACPCGTDGAYSILSAARAEVVTADCLGFVFRAEQASDDTPGVWQYV